MATAVVPQPGFVNRLVRAAKLEVGLFEEVEADKSATKQAALIVIAGAIIAGVGNATEGGWLGVVIGIAVGLIGWAIWAWLNYWIGAKLFPEKTTVADWGQLARTMGFASTPRLFVILLLIPVPVLRGLLALVILVWFWVAMVIAVRQALDYSSTLRAVGVTLVGAILNAVALIVVNVVLIDWIKGLVD